MIDPKLHTLCMSIKNRDFSVITELVGEGIDLNAYPEVLFSLLDEHDREMLEHWLRLGARIEIVHDELLTHVWYTSASVLELAIEYGLDLKKVVDKDGLTLIHYEFAITTDESELDQYRCRMMLYRQYGLDFNNRKNAYGRSPLAEALVDEVPTSYIGVLLEFGAIPDLNYLQNEKFVTNSQTPIHLALSLDPSMDTESSSTQKSLDYIRMMTAKSIYCPDVFDENGLKPLEYPHFRSLKPNMPLKQMDEKHRAADVYDIYDDSDAEFYHDSRKWLESRQKASDLHNTEISRILMAVGATPLDSDLSFNQEGINEEDDLQQFNPLAYWPLPQQKPVPFCPETAYLVEAVVQGDLVRLEKIINRFGFPLNATARNGVPLYVAMRKGDWPLLQRLVELGADPNLSPGQLIQHAPSLPPEMVAWLIEHGADFTGRDSKGFTVLHKEIIWRKRRVAQEPQTPLEPFAKKLEMYLLAGVDINDRHNANFCPPVVLWLKAKYQLYEMLGLMFDHGAVIDLPCHAPDIVPDRGRGPSLLHGLIADEQADPQQLLLLLRFIAERSPFCSVLRDGYGYPLLHTAVRYSAAECVRFVLTELKAPVELTDLNDRTALEYLVQLLRVDRRIRLSDPLEKMRILLEHGADPQRERLHHPLRLTLTKEVLNASEGTWPEEVRDILKLS